MIKTVYTPITGGFEESYKERKYFDTIHEVLEYLTEKENSNSMLQCEIKYYTYSKNLKKDRFIILCKDYQYSNGYPIGFLHYEEIPD